MGETVIVKSRETAHSPTSTPKYRRLTASDVGVCLKLRRDGLTQVQIAQRLGCSQKAVSEWLDKCEDSTEASKVYLRGQALRMAQNIVAKGRAADHVKTLEGLEVLSNQEVRGGLTIVVGGSAQVQVNVGTGAAGVTLSPTRDV